jgi:3',5'-cyclic AMP phosphodiesterase CpdA
MQERDVNSRRNLALMFMLLCAYSFPVFCQSVSNAPLPQSVADLKPFELDDRILKAAPRVEVQPDGSVTVYFETMVPTPRARAFMGLLNPDTPLETPLFQLTAREPQQELTTSHRLKFDLKEIETEEQRSGTSPAHEDDVSYRLEIFDPRSAGPEYFESRFHYFAQAGRYEKRMTILYGPYLDQVTDRSVVIFWTTDLPSRGAVDLFADKSPTPLKRFTGGATLETDHKVKVTGLGAGSTYHYQALVLEASGEKPVTSSRIYKFHAAPARDQRFEFAFMSDGRPSPGGGFSDFGGVNADITQRLLADSHRRGAEFILFGGDLVAGYTSSVENFDLMLNTWKLISEPVSHLIPIYEGMGNHESLADFFRDAAKNIYNRDKAGRINAESEFARHFANPDENYPAPEVRNGIAGPSYRGTVYSFDYGNSHFVMLNMDYWFTGAFPLPNLSLPWTLLGGNREGYIMENQMKWLAQDLADARKRGVEHIFVCGHDMAFPTGGHASDAMWWNGLNDPSLPLGDVTAMRDRFMTLVNKFRVTALLFGHEHNYSRTIIDHSVDKVMQHPVTQIISGGAGAPFYPRDTKVPWSSAVKKHAMVNHYVLVTVDKARVTLSAIDLDGNVFDSATLP